MTLYDYLKGFDKPSADAFAERCRTTFGQLRQVAYGNRRASAGLAVDIERESGRAVICEDLRPDTDWAYLRRSTAA